MWNARSVCHGYSSSLAEHRHFIFGNCLHIMHLISPNNFLPGCPGNHEATRIRDRLPYWYHHCSRASTIQKPDDVLKSPMSKCDMFDYNIILIYIFIIIIFFFTLYSIEFVIGLCHVIDQCFLTFSLNLSNYFSNILFDECLSTSIRVAVCFNFNH